MINGNLEGIRKSLLEEMEKIYQFEIQKDEFVTYQLLEAMAYFTGEINREVSVYISRDGEILDVSVGEINRVELPYLRLRRSQYRLSRIRCIHTHPGGDGKLSSVDLHSLQTMKFDSMAAVGVQEGKAHNLYAAFLGNPISEDQWDIRILGPYPARKIPSTLLMSEIEAADECVSRQASVAVQQDGMERALLVGVEKGEGDSSESLEELARLAETAGALVIGKELQKKRQIDAATYIGSGKVNEISLLCQSKDIDVVIFDDELSGAQTRNLEEALGTKVIDRTTLILDIFASRAQSREGKLQVELAQLKYRLPRLMGLGQVLSRLGGGIGTRGPGEKKLEVDRRRIRRRIFELEQEIKEVKKQRDARRARREKNIIPVVALVGYTNSGKSTLLNLLSHSDVLAEDRLFATLDPVTRKVALPDGREFLLVDTVGFINKLPHDLVEAFHSTLEEALYADLLIHVVDASSPVMTGQMKVVDHVLDSLGAGQKKRITVYNKMDLVPEMEMWELPDEEPSIAISAKTGAGVDALLEAISRALDTGRTRQEILIPYTQGAVLSFIHKNGNVYQEEYREDGICVDVLMDNVYWEKVRKMLGLPSQYIGEE